MKKSTILVILAVMATFTAVGAAEDLGATLEVATMSKYMWRGFDRYDNKGAVNTSVDLDLFGSGFGVNVMYSQPLSSGFENAKWIPATLYYANKDVDSGLEYVFGYTYYNLPDNSDKFADMQEVFGTIALRNETGFVPNYTAIYMWPSRSGSFAAETNSGGWIHVFGLDYEQLAIGDQKIRLLSNVTYNGGTGAVAGSVGVPVDHDWSHFVVGAETTFALSSNLSFKPGVYYQRAWERTVNSSQEDIWAIGSFILAF